MSTLYSGNCLCSIRSSVEFNLYISLTLLSSTGPILSSSPEMGYAERKHLSISSEHNSNKDVSVLTIKFEALVVELYRCRIVPSPSCCFVGFLRRLVVTATSRCGVELSCRCVGLSVVELCVVKMSVRVRMR